MKALVQIKQYPLIMTSSGAFNLNNRDWSKLGGRIEWEESYSRSSIRLLYPPNANRDTQMLYSVNSKIDIPGIPVQEVENYFDTSNPLNIRISSSSDSWESFPLNTWKMSDDAITPSDIYGSFFHWEGQKPYIMLGSRYWNENYAVYVISPQWRLPSFYNVAVNGSDPRAAITLSWQATRQDLFDAQIWQDGVLKKTISGTTEQSAVIPANTLHDGPYTATLIAANNPVDDLGVTATISTSFTASTPKPTAGSLAINQPEPRLPITLSWASTNQTDFRADIIQGGAVKSVLTGSAEKNATIPAVTLTEGPFTANLYVNNTVNGVTSTTLISQEFNAILDKPVITSLEPDRINNNVNLPILCTWASTRQEAFTLKLIQDNVTLKTYSGTTEQSLNIPPDEFKNGTCRLELTATNVINGTTATATKTAEFLGYGRPALPVFTDQTIYNKALPLFGWTADEQIAFRFEIYKDSLLHEDSGEVISSISSYQVENSLINNSTYIIKVKTKNQFGLWSEYAEKEITTNYSTLSKPEFTLTPDASGGILVNINITPEAGFSSAEIWRKDKKSKFARMATNMPTNGQWTDYTVASDMEYSYKVISLTSDGGLVESDTKTSKITIRGFNFTDLIKNEPLKLQKNPKMSIGRVRDTASMEFAGRTAPVVKKGSIDYKILKLGFEVDDIELDQFENLVSNSDIILYRDGRGNKVYGQIFGEISTVPVKNNLKRHAISFAMTETAFIEKDLFRGDA